MLMRRVRRKNIALAQSLFPFAAVLLLLGCAASTPPSGTAATIPTGWPTGLMPVVAEALGQDEAWRPRPTKHGAEAHNVRHGLHARFGADGLHLSTEAGAIHLAFAGIGRGRTPHVPGAATAEVDGARVLYRRGPQLTEWFINSPLGLEQGFTFNRRPEGQGELRLALNLSGDLAPRLEGDELVFIDREGRTRLRYGALSAYDADGRPLPARMALEGQRLVLAVDDSGARYPVVVDPLFSAETKLIAPDGAASDQFGFSVALDGDTAIVGAPWAESNGVSNRGAAYVFVRDGADWKLQARLKVHGT